jgi:hypothetical protein
VNVPVGGIAGADDQELPDAFVPGQVAARPGTERPAAGQRRGQIRIGAQQPPGQRPVSSELVPPA